MNHPEFGNFTHNEYLGWYEGKVVVNNGEITLYISAESEDEVLSILVLAESFLKSLEKEIALAKDFAADELLELRNGGWREEHSIETSKDEFVLRLSCLSITLYPDQSAEIVFNDGGLFYDHVVLVSGNTQGQFSDASMAG